MIIQLVNTSNTQSEEKRKRKTASLPLDTFGYDRHKQYIQPVDTMSTQSEQTKMPNSQLFKCMKCNVCDVKLVCLSERDLVSHMAQHHGDTREIMNPGSYKHDL